MKKLSLRARLTMTVLIILSAMALMLTLVAMYNSGVLSGAMANSYAVALSTNAGGSNGMVDDDAVRVEENIVQYDADGESAYAETDMLPLFPLPTTTTVVADDAYDADGSVAIFAVSALQSSFNYTSIIFMLIIIAGGGVITYFALGRALRPVRRLSEEIGGITENGLDVRVTEFRAGDEINRLADSFNTLMERLEKAFATQKDFAASAAHELKTPLAAIKANIGVLEMDERPTSADYAQTIGVVKKQAERMTGLVDDMFAMSSGDYDTADEVDVGMMINSILADVSHRTKGKKLETTVHTQLENKATTNKGMLRRVLANVIGNAVRYTDSHGKIEIGATENSSGFRIEVADDGPGIDEKDRENIFLPFYRVDNSRSRKAGGAGLGLAIAKGMAEKLGGSIEARASEPRGSLFVIWIPKL